MRVFLRPSNLVVSGFSLVELIIALAILGILGAVAVPVYSGLQVGNDLDIAATAVAQSLRRAQLLSQGVDGDAPWGVRVQAGEVILFRGASFAQRDANFDERFDLSTSLSPAGLQEVTFARLTGLPTAVGTFTMTTPNGESKIISINGKGMVAY